MGHGHTHDARSTAAGRNKNRLLVVLGLTTLYLAAEVVGGLVTHSLALLADAGHMLTDVGGLVLALVGIKLAERPASPERTYGYYRVEILAALTNAVLLIGTRSTCSSRRMRGSDRRPWSRVAPCWRWPRSGW